MVRREDVESLSDDGTANMDISVVYPAEFLLTLTTGLFSGTRCLLIGASPWCLHVEIATATNARQKAFVSRCELTSSEGELLFVFTRWPFPVTPCFEMTINRVQGETLERVGIFLRRPVFSHGQLYVVVSRAISRENLWFMVVGGSSTLPDGSQGICTANTVYEEGLHGSGREGPHVRCPG